MSISHAVQMLKRIPSLLSPARWLYYGMAMVFADILLMMMRYLGVVLKTNALAELVVHHDVLADQGYSGLSAMGWRETTLPAAQ
jgi:hypothetical protein